MRYWLFRKLLFWYATKELDQWDMWKLSTPHGKVYVTISRSPEPAEDRHFHEFL